jgi:hypothetical protein
MVHRAASSALLVWFVLLLGSLPVARGGPKPFPVDKTIDLKEPGQVYTVEGRQVNFDGNNARSTTTTFAQSEYGAFQGTKIGNCDFRTQLVFRAPPDELSPDKAERLLLDHSWFGGRTEDEDVARAMILDQRKDPGIAVLCTFSKICPAPLRLAGSFESN